MLYTHFEEYSEGHRKLYPIKQGDMSIEQSIVAAALISITRLDIHTRNQTHDSLVSSHTRSMLFKQLQLTSMEKREHSYNPPENLFTVGAILCTPPLYARTVTFTRTLQ